MKYLFSFLLFFVVAWSFGQSSSARRRIAQHKDTLSILLCPLHDAAEPPAPALSYGDTKQDGITLVSKTDTTVRSAGNATVSRIQRDAEGKFEVVLFYNDYWFWYSGLSKVSVKRNQVLKAGETIGIIELNAPIDLLLYDFETPVDPHRYLDCFKGR